MMLILNRLRGTEGLWSKIIGLLLALVVQIAFNNPYVSLAVGLGYIIGESFGWGDWVGTLTSGRTVMPVPYTEGKNNGIQWLATKVVDPVIRWREHCRVALTIRGFYWWLPTLAPLYFVGFDPYYLTIAVVLLGVGFPIACEIGYRTQKLFSVNKPYFHMTGGWEHQEVWYGVIQDLVFIGLGISYWMGV